MTRRATRLHRSVAKQAAELALAVPPVMAHRLTRLAIAGPTPSARDRQEFQRMVAEKHMAFIESWRAMAMQALRSQQWLAMSWLRSLGTPWRPQLPDAGQVAARLQGAAVGVLGKGLAPVRRQAVANARRLARTPLR